VKRDEIKIVNDLRRERFRQEIVDLREKQAAALQRSSCGGMSPRESEEYEERKTRIAMLETRLQKTTRKITFIWG
jgi:hypothetical protein